MEQVRKEWRSALECNNVDENPLAKINVLYGFLYGYRKIK